MKPRKQFGKYELHEELGRGSIGIVYKAVALDSGQEVALKVLQAAAVLDEKDLRRFEHEARLVARVKHPGVVAVLDVGVERGIRYVAFELVKGRPLAEVELPLREHVLLLARTGRAIGAAHRAKVVHRDLKPSNVLVDSATGEPRVVDFGFAFDARFEMSRLSATGEIVGTPAYMAPETVLGTASPNDPRLDVYALGVMLYARLMGGHPFRGLTATAAFAEVAKGIPPIARAPGVDGELARLVNAAISVNRLARPADGDAFASGLESWLAHRVPERHASLTSVESRGRRGRRPLVAVLLVALAVCGLLLLREHAQPPPRVEPPPPAPKPPPPPPPRPKPKRHVRPVAPEPAHPANAAIVAELDVSIDEVQLSPDKLTRAAQLTQRLQIESPDDSRTLHFAAFIEFLRSNEYDARRGFIRALRASPPLGPRALRRTVYFSRLFGFERAAAAIAARAYPDESYPPRLGVTLAFLYLTAMPPLCDFERAERIASRALEGDVTEGPLRFELVSTRAQIRLALGQRSEAAADFAQAAREAEVAGFAGAIASYHERERRCRVGEATADLGPRAFTFNLAPTDFLAAVEKANQLWREWTPDGLDEAARAFVNLAEQEARKERYESAGIAALRAGWAWQRAGALDNVRLVLEKALELVKDRRRDSHALVARSLAQYLLDRGVDVAIAEKLALGATEGAEEPGDERDDDELAEAWGLVARARGARGDKEGARRAIDEAEAWGGGR